MAEVTLSLEEYKKLEDAKAELEKMNERYRCLSNGFSDYFKRFDENVMKQIHVSYSFGLSCSKCGSTHSVLTVSSDVVNGIRYNLCEKCRHSYYYQHAAINFRDVKKFILEKTNE